MLKAFSILQVLILLITPLAAFAGGVFQSQESFVNQTFGDKAPASKVIWINKERRKVVEKILQHRTSFIRVRYWQQGSKSAWILSEIGKTKQISVGIVIDDNKISTVKVLAFHESRGWEVKHDFFTKQFQHASLDSNHHLTNEINGISGATLSVRALRKIARIALYLNQQINEKISSKQTYHPVPPSMA